MLIWILSVIIKTVKFSPFDSVCLHFIERVQVCRSFIFSPVTRLTVERERCGSKGQWWDPKKMRKRVVSERLSRVRVEADDRGMYVRKIRVREEGVSETW